MNQLTLRFYGTTTPQLESTLFSNSGLKCPYQAFRGRTPDVFPGAGTFQWSAAVRALALLLLETAAWAEDSEKNSKEQPRLEGERGSAALSLDYALSKQPVWLLDMFGVARNGEATARRVFNRINPERKRPGPVVLSLNLRFMTVSQVKVYWNGEEVTSSPRLEELCDQIMRQSSRPADAGVLLEKPLYSRRDLNFPILGSTMVIG